MSTYDARQIFQLESNISSCQLPTSCEDVATVDLLSLRHMLVLHDADALPRSQHILSIWRIQAYLNTS